jgi:hypothetical protein
VDGISDFVSKSKGSGLERLNDQCANEHDDVVFEE